MPYSIPDMEQAMVAMLEPLKESAGVRTIKVYEGELELDDLSRITVPMPAIFVVWVGATYADLGERQIEDNRFTLFCCNKGLRRDRRGDSGTHELVREARRLLVGRTILDGLFPCRPAPQGERALGWSAGYSVVAGVYSVRQALLFPEGT